MKPAISIVAHGASGVGKSRFAATAPAPRLIIDAENGSRFTPGRKTSWNYWTDPPPVADGTWDTVLVNPREWRDVERILDWLESGQHPFVSVILDSMTEIQKRLIDMISGVEQVKQAEWGEIWRRGDDFARKLRDLIMDSANKPLEVMVILALTEEDSKSKIWRPALSGKLAQYLGSHADLTAYMYVEQNFANGNVVEYKMLISKTQFIEARDRTGVLVEHFGSVVSGVGIPEMLAIIAPLFN